MFSRTLIISLVFVILPAIALAGPPFRTDDPEPVEYQHWEFYVASQGSFGNGSTMTAPHVEINYGVLPNVQLHLLAPFEYVNPKGENSHYGYGDSELGVKFRFIQETDWRPQVGVFPIVVLPTGDEDKNLGTGKVQAFFPIWLQKSWEPWKTYGGGGYWINPGSGNRDYWFFGWEVEREMSEYLTIGAEIYHQTASERGGDSDTGFNIGAIVNFSEMHHLLLSAGRDISGSNDFSYYVGYQLTFGP
jgi:hypothetical protein